MNKQSFSLPANKSLFLFIYTIILIFQFAPVNAFANINAVDKCGAINSNEIWTSNNTYLLTCDVTIYSGVTVTIEAGTIIKANSNSDLFVDGNLVSQGTAGNKVVFTSYRDDDYGGDSNGDGVSTGSPGDWSGIAIRSNETTVVNNVIIRFARTALTVQANSSDEVLTPTIQNSMLTDSSYYGLYAYASSSNSTASPTVVNTQIQNSNQYGVYVNASNGRTAQVNLQNSAIHHNNLFPIYLYSNGWVTDLGGTSIHDNGFNAIGVANVLYEDRTWGPIQGLPYWIDSDVTVASGTTLTLPAGTIIKADSSSDLFVDGNLVSQGTAGNKVVFTSYRDDDYGGDSNGDGVSAGSPGDWSGIAIRSNETTVVNNVIVRYARTALTVQANSSDEVLTPTIQNSMLTDSSYYGLYAYASSSNSTASPTVVNTQIQNSNQYGVYVNASNGRTAQVNLQNSAIHHNNLFPIYLYSNGWVTDLGGTSIHDNGFNAIGVANVLYEDRTWGPIQGLPYWIDSDVTVASGTTLTLPAGTIIKADSSSDLFVDGNLVSQGTAGNKVVFTSYRDDDYGGDSNGDGISAGSPGDWGGITIRSNETAVVNNVIVRYARTALTIQANSSDEVLMPTIQNSMLTDSSYYGLYAYASSSNSTASPTVVNTQIQNSNQYGVYVNASNGRTAQVNLQNSAIHHNNLFPIYLYSNGWVTDLGGTSIHDNGFNAIGVANVLYEDRTWGPIQGLPYWIDSDVTVASGTTLTLPAGTIIKADSSSDLFVDGNLVSQGTAGNKVVFTSYRDDDYGGDSNGDGVSAGYPGDWSGIEARTNQAMEHNIIRYAATGLELRAYNQDNSSVIRLNNFENNSNGIHLYAYNGTNTSQIISNTLEHNRVGILVTGSGNFSNEITQNDIISNTNYGISNQTPILINAINNWWGHNSGPYYASNPTGLGDTVSDNVQFSPWLSDFNFLHVQIDIDKLIGPSPLTVVFTPTIRGGEAPYLYFWDFNNDGLIDKTDAISEWKFSGAGVYPVTLLVKDANGNEAHAIQTIIVEPPLPVIDIPLEIVILQDETGSMGDDIGNLKALAPEIWDSIGLMANSGFRMSVIGFRDYAHNGWGSSSDWVYRLHQDFTEDRSKFINGISSLSASGGGDTPEAQLAALYYLNTPAHPCIDSNGNGNCSDSFDTAVGQQPNFLPFAKRVILLATDAGFHDSASYPGPEANLVIESLKNNNTTVIGLVPGGSGRITQVDFLASQTGGSVEDTGSTGQDVAIAIAEAVGDFASVPGTKGTLELSTAPFLTDTDPINSRLKITNPDSVEHTYKLTVHLLQGESIVETITVENITLGAAGITNEEVTFSAKPTAQYIIHGILELDSSTIRQQYAVVTVLNPDAQHIAENEASELTQAALDEFDDMSDRVAEALSRTLIEAGWEIFSKVLEGYLKDLLSDAIPDHANIIFTQISEQYEEILYLSPEIDIFIRNYALEFYQVQLPVDFTSTKSFTKDAIEDVVDFLVDQGRSQLEAEEIANDLQNIAQSEFNRAIRGLISRTITKDDINLVIERNQSFNEFISTQPFSWNTNLDSEFNRGRVCISQVTESYPIASYRFEVLGNEYGDDITMIWYEDQQNTVIETSDTISNILMILKLAVIVVGVIVAILVAVLSLGSGAIPVAAIFGKVYHFLTVIKGLVTILKFVALILILVAMLLSIHKIAPIVTEEHDQTLGAVETLISSDAKNISIDDITIARDGRDIDYDVYLENESTHLVSDNHKAMLSTMIYSSDGRVTDCSWDEVNLDRVQQNEIVSQDFEVVGDGYRAVSALYGADQLPMAVEEAMIDSQTATEYSLNLILDQEVYQPGDPIDIFVEITNNTGLTADDLLLAVESNAGVNTDLQTFDLTPHETETFSFQVAANDPGSFVMRATIIGNGFTPIAQYDQPYVVGTGLATAINVNLASEVLPAEDVVADLAIYTVGDSSGTAEISLRTLDRLDSFSEIHTATNSYTLNPGQQINRDVIVLPAEKSYPGLYRTWFYLDDVAYAYYDFTITATDTLFSILYFDEVNHEVNDEIPIFVEVTNAAYAFVDANVVATVTRPDGIVLNPTLTKMDTGKYEGVVSASVSGTYIVEVQIEKEGYRAYNDSGIFIAGNRSEMSVSIEGRPVLNVPRTITFTVSNEYNQPVSNANLLLENSSDFLTTKTNEDGITSLYLSPTSADSYEISAQKAGYDLFKTDMPVYIPTDVYPPGLVLFDIPKITNQDTINIHGATEPDALLTVNSEPVSITGSGHFTFSTHLNPGDNSLLFQVSDSFNNTRVLTEHIELDQQVPLLIVNQATLEDDVVYLVGVTEPGVVLTVDDAAIPVDENGEFAYWHAVLPSQTTVRLKATDAAGNNSILIRNLSGFTLYLPIILR